MKVNPGGEVAPDDVIGRDALVKKLHDTLKQQSAILVAERRSGKTTVLKKLLAEFSDEQLILFRDFEAISHPLEFVQRVGHDVEQYLSTLNKAAKRAKTLLEKLSGSSAFGFKLPEAAKTEWKELLENVLADLAEHAQHQVVFLWDEVPWMVQKIKKNHGEAVAVDLLDTLRGIRNNHSKLRMVYTGSIGFHHVLKAFNDEGYINSPENDMLTIELPPLTFEDASHLASNLLAGEKLTCDEPKAVAEQIASLSDQAPYYIHHIVASLVNMTESITTETVTNTVSQALIAAHDPWDLEHYRNRLAEYYRENAEFANNLLDLFAEHQSLKLPELQQLLMTSSSTMAAEQPDKRHIRSLVKQLQRDHYLVQNTDSSYQFRSSLIRRWWRLDLGLAEETNV